MTVQTLDLRTGLQTRLTQKMQQAIKLLQLNNQELSQVVATYIEQNPLIEMESSEDEWESNENFEEEGPLDDLYDADFDNYYQDDRRAPSLSDQEYDAMTSYARPQSLRSYIAEYIGMIIDSDDQKLAHAMADLLDERGYLIPDFDKELSKKYSSEAIQRVLFKLQTLEPTGIFARNMEECLMLQLRERGCDHPKMEAFLHELSRSHGDIPKISRILNISIESCHALLSLLNPLNPKPALAFGGGEGDIVVPDLLMKRKGGHDWVIELNPSTLPKVAFDQDYYLSLKAQLKSMNDRNYLQEKFQESKWLIKSLQQRAMNMHKIAEVIIQKQEAFFKTSRGAIKPLTLREVAVETELSESTVSRITTGKYIQTPRGTLELKYFFSSVASELADDQSAKSVQNAIKILVDRENPTHPLSDTEIAEKLSLQGMSIARRTVAKYRDVLKIDNVTERKRFYEWQQTGSKINATGA